MKFDAFDRTEQARLAAEVREKWGGTAAYQEYRQRRKKDDGDDLRGLMDQFAALGQLKALAPTAPEVQEAILRLQQFITAHFYTCTLEILAGLGEMYVADERFRQSIDRSGGKGTAVFTRDAIRVFCGK